jgi:hypothetical protein
LHMDLDLDLVLHMDESSPRKSWYPMGREGDCNHRYSCKPAFSGGTCLAMSPVLWTSAGVLMEITFTLINVSDHVLDAHIRWLHVVIVLPVCTNMTDYGVRLGEASLFILNMAIGRLLLP